MKATPPPDQASRLAVLREFDILDTPREVEFDEIVELASRICQTPISVINLIDGDRQWFKAETGLGVRETPLDTSICAHVILTPGLTVIPDTLEDPRMADNPLCLGAPHLRFYAGATLMSESGHPIGTLCVLDNRPRNLDELQKFALTVLARQVMSLVKLRKIAARYAQAKLLSDETIEELRRTAKTRDILVQEVDHRVKNSLAIVAGFLNLQSKQASTEEAVRSLTTARDRVYAVAALHEQLHVSADYDRVDMQTFARRLVKQIAKSAPDTLKFIEDVTPLWLDTKSAATIGVIINEVITNSLKHAFAPGQPGELGIRLRPHDEVIALDIWDTGNGDAAVAQKGRVGGLGTRVIHASAQQLGGKVRYEQNNPGIRIFIQFPRGESQDMSSS